MKVYGITGSIACGKSTVTAYLIDHGFTVIDADKISREALTVDENCISQVKTLFGCFHDGQIDRKALGKIVFHDETAKKQLEAIIHPYVIARLKAAISDNSDKDFIFLDIPLLYESHLEYLCDKVIVVYANEKKQLQRLMKRDHIDEVYAKAIIANQISSSIKKDKADIVLDNNGNIDELYKQIKKMMKGIENESIVNE